MMDARGYQNYKAQSLNTMTQGELLVLLLDELVKRVMRCELALEQKDYDLLESTVDRCLEIIRYLDDTLDFRYEISWQLHRMYDFFSYDLNRVRFGRNKEELDRLQPMIIDLRDSFRTAERGGSQSGQQSGQLGGRNAVR